MNASKIDSIKKYGITASGRKELLKHLSSERVTLRQAVIAKCYDCMSFYGDGRNDCNSPDCPLYPFMPYGTKPQAPIRKLSETHKARLSATKKMRSKAVEPFSGGVSANEQPKDDV